MVKLQYMMHSKMPEHHLKAMENAADKLRIILDIRDISDDYPAVVEAVTVASNIISMLDVDVRNLLDASKGIVNDASNGILNDKAADLPEIQPVNGQDANADLEVVLEEDDEELSDESFYSDASYSSSDYFTETSGFVSDDTYEMTDWSVSSEYSELNESFNW